jgi:hypothetical protein
MANRTYAMVKFSAVFGAMMLLTACTAGGQSRRPSAALPDGWHKYTDARFGFEIAYPDEYGIVPERNPAPFGAVKRVRFQDKQLLSSEFVDVEPPRFAVEVFEWSQPVPLADWLRSKGRLPADATITEVTLAGAREGVRLQLRQAIAPNDFVYFASNEFVYLLTPLGEHAEAMFQSFRLQPVNTNRRPARSR